MLPVTWVDTREIPLTELGQFPGNARRGDVGGIRASLRRNGQYRSLVVRDTGSRLVILAGNHTSEALAAEGHTAARCEVVTCTDDEATRINLADNRLADLGDYDNPQLLSLLATLEEDLDATGYTLDELDDLRAALEEVPTMDGQPSGARWAETDEELAQREQQLSGQQSRIQPGTAELVLVMTVDEREEFVELVRLARERDGDLPAAQIALAALRSYAPAAA